MDALYEKRALIIAKREELDSEDKESVEYTVSLYVGCDNPDPDTHKGHVQINVVTDDKVLFDKFTVGQFTDLKFLKPETVSRAKVRAN